MTMVGLKSVTPLILATTVLLTACGKKTEEDRAEVIRPAKLILIQGAVGQQRRLLPATIGAPRKSDLSFSIGGLLMELTVKDAQKVVQGELVAKLDQRDFVSKVAAAKSQFENARSEYGRAVRLAKEDAVAGNVLEQRKMQMDTARAQLDAAAKALSDTELRAPFSGVVSKVAVKQHQNIQSGQVVASMFASQTMEAIVNMPARVIAQSRSRTNTVASVILDAAPATPLLATFREASLEADPVSQTYEVAFTFTPPNDLVVLPGMNATVELLLEMPPSAPGERSVRVPLGAILSDGDRHSVWVVDKDTMRVSKRFITIRDGIGENLVVTDGLVPGDTIVGAGAAYLAEGMIVRQWSE